MVDLSKITEGKNLSDMERTVLYYIVEHIDEVLKMGVRGVARGELHVLVHHHAVDKEAGVQRICGYVLQAAADGESGAGDNR